MRPFTLLTTRRTTKHDDVDIQSFPQVGENRF